MKKIILNIFVIFTLLILTNINLLAIPANPNLITKKQPNGKTLTFIIQGDEWVNWAKTIDGYTLINNEKGVLVYAMLDERGNLISSKYIAANSDERTAEERLFLSTLPYNLRYSKAQIDQKLAKKNELTKKTSNYKVTTTGTVRQLLILVAFSDKSFTYTQNDFQLLSNQVGYSVNGATGSVKDYYRDNSGGLLNMDIDVVGPFTLPNTSQYYAGVNGHDNMQSFVSTALTLADPTVDFSQYLNGGTKVANIHFVFAGQPRSSTNDINDIWPHEYTMAYWGIEKDGIEFSTYSCSAEKKTATQIDGIGTMCHEMGHSLGLMDLYDTDYDGSGGTAVTPGKWSLMDGGAYNNSNNTPPYLNGWERKLLNWGDPILINTSHNAILPCMADSLKSYKIDLSNNEYLLVEHRKQKGWDAYAPGNGLLIYHADKTRLEGTSIFRYNSINKSPADRGFFIEVASGVLSDCSTLNSTFGSVSGKMLFTSTSSPAALLKDGSATNKPITHIRYINDSTMSFNLLSSLPQVSTLNPIISTIKGTTATVNGKILYLATSPIIEKGMYWHTHADSANSTYGTKAVSNSIDDSIKTNLINLPPSTIIYYRAYAKNSLGTSEAINPMSFTTTDGLPTIVSSNPTNIQNNGAVFNGNVLTAGDTPIIEKGFVYSTNINESPTLSNTKVLHSDILTGIYSVNVTGLAEQTSYAYRAFVTTSIGTKYGAKKIFTTTFPAILNNTISDNQTFCNQGIPQELIGLVPSGGHGNFTYKWEQKTRNEEWISATQTNTGKNYQPENLIDSTFYRRIVFSNTLKDTSNIILINIKNSWGGVLNSPNDTIIKNNSTGNISLSQNKGSVLNWERKKDEENWTIIDHTTKVLSEILAEVGNYTYRVKVKLDNCPEAYSSGVQIYVKNGEGLRDIDINNIDLKLYPNPAKESIRISSSYSDMVEIRILNNLGQVLKEEKASIKNKNIDLTSLNNGTYLLIIYANGQEITKTIIINK